MKTITLLIAYVDLIQEKANDYLFKNQHRKNPEDFTRKRILNFVAVMLIMLNFKTKSNALSAYNFTTEIADTDCVSRQAFDKSRDKIKSSAFKELFEDGVDMALSVDDPKLFAGFRVNAIDGSVVLLPKSDVLTKEYGKTTPLEGKTYARISLCADVLNGIILDGEISGYDTGERKLAMRHVKKQLAYNILNLYDRGYWSPELVAAMCDRKQRFLIRLASNSVSVVTKSKEDSGSFTIKYKKKEYTLRYYKFLLQSGEMEYLATNLTHDEVSDSQLPELYHLRWGVETKYDELKNRLQFECFSGKNVNAIVQEFYASMIVMNMTGFAIAAADVKVKEDRADKDNKHEYKPNGNMAVGILKDRLIKAIIENDPEIRAKMLGKLIKDISKFVVPIRQDRHSPRSKTNKCRCSHKTKNPL